MFQNIKLHWKYPVLKCTTAERLVAVDLGCHFHCLFFLGVWHLDRENLHALRKWPKQNQSISLKPETMKRWAYSTDTRCCDRGTHLSGSRVSWPTLAKVKSGLVPTIHWWEEKRTTPLSLAVAQVVGYCSRSQFPTVRRFCAVVSVDMLAVEVASIQIGDVAMAVGVSHDGGGL